VKSSRNAVLTETEKFPQKLINLSSAFELAPLSKDWRWALQKTKRN